MNYSVVMKNSIDVLVKTVNEMINDGWRPIGGVQRDRIGGLSDIFYLQAMIRENNETPVKELPAFPKIPTFYNKPTDEESNSYED